LLQNNANLEFFIFCFGFFHVVVLVLLAKQEQQKIGNLFTISVFYAWALVMTDFNRIKIVKFTSNRF
jgi:hypothetical protein